MKYLPLDELVPGTVYLFRRSFNSKTIILQPATFLGVWTNPNVPAPKRPHVKWIIDGVETTTNVGNGEKVAAPITKAWVQRQMNDRADQIRALTAENSALFNLYKGLP